MMEDEKDCKAVITQLSAVRSAVDRSIGVIVTENLVSCMSEENKKSMNQDEIIKQAVDLLLKSR